MFIHIEQRLMMDEDADEFLTYVAACLNSEGYRGVMRLTEYDIETYREQFTEMKDAANDDYYNVDDDESLSSLAMTATPEAEYLDVRKRTHGVLALQFLAEQLDEVPPELCYSPVAHDLCDLLDTVALTKQCEAILASLDPDVIPHA